MITVNLHYNNEVPNVEAFHRPPDAPSGEYAVLKFKQGNNEVCVFMHNPDQVLHIITQLNILHCDWLKCKEDKPDLPFSNDLGGEA